MEKRSIFIKQYTRDTLLIMQEAWAQGFACDYDGRKNPYKPTHIYYVNNGIVEIWENKKAISWFKIKLLRKNLSDGHFYFKSMDRYIALLARMNWYREKKVLRSMKQLEDFIDLAFEMSRNFLIFYFSAMNPKTPTKIRRHAEDLRNKDNFYEDAGKLIRKSLDYLIPRLGGLEISIMKKDLAHIPSCNELKNRKKHFIMIPDRAQATSINWKKFLKDNKKFSFVDDEIKNTNLIRGKAINTGTTVGLVRIVRTRDEIKKVKRGEILVTYMTTPDFIPAMKLAAGFITDEGGILCHAAVVAREFNKPCIIGTKIATKILKNGDLVEVNSNKGLIKKITKKL